jgi:hypothetical protein
MADDCQAKIREKWRVWREERRWNCWTRNSVGKKTTQKRPSEESDFGGEHLDHLTDSGLARSKANHLNAIIGQRTPMFGVHPLVCTSPDWQLGRLLKMRSRNGAQTP